MSRWLSKKEIKVVLSIMILLGVFFVVQPASAAAIGDAVAKVLGWIIYALVYVIGLILMLVMWVLIKIAQYNDFINAEPVVYGWAIVRDFCNMFFILIMLIIAFATILRVEQYSFKKMLPKLIIMAVLINFSKLICGLLIDFAQVIMLTFVNGFKEIGSGNLTSMLGIDKLMNMSASASDSGDVSLWSIVGSYMLALIYATIALVVIITMLAVLAMRMIMIWVYVVLSPLAYLLAAVPGGQKYSGQWWEEFSKNLIVGPVLAFFIWLSFASLGGVDEPKVVSNIKNIDNKTSGVDTQLATTTSGPTAGITEAGSPDHMIKFIISIAMLLGGLQVSQQIGGQAGGIAGKGMQRLQKMGSGAMKSIGTGLKRATGVERVQMAYKSYKDMKQMDRSQRAREDAIRANRTIGKTKETLAKPFNKLEDKTAGRLAANFGGKRQKTAEAEKERLIKAKADNQKERETFEANLENKKTALKNSPQGIQTLAALEAEREAIRNDRTISGVVKMDRLADVDRRDPLKELDRKAQITRDQFDARDNKVDQGISSKDAEISKAQDRQVKAKKWISGGMAAAIGVGLGAATGGIGAIAGIGGVGGAIGAGVATAASGFGGLQAKKNLKNAGKDNLRRASQYNTQKVSTNKEAMKFMGKNKLMDTIRNSSDHHEQAAATMLALEKGDVFADSAEAGKYKKQVADRFKGDDRIDSMLESSAMKNYPEHCRPISELNLGGVKADEASKKIVDNLNAGVTKISELSAAAIDLTVKDIASGLKDKTFRDQFDKSSDDNKEVIKKSLTKEATRAERDLSTARTPEERKAKDEHLYKTKKKLAYTKSQDINAFGPSTDASVPQHMINKAHKDKYLEEMKDDEVKKVIKNKDTKAQFFNEIKIRLEGSGLNAASSPDDVADALKGILKNAGLDSANDSVTKAIVSSVRNNIPGLR